MCQIVDTETKEIIAICYAHSDASRAANALNREFGNSRFIVRRK